MTFLIYLVGTLLVVVCLLLVLLVLMQRPKQEGLGAAFGAGVTDQIWGAQTTNVLQKSTVTLGVCFFVLSLILAMLKAHESRAMNGFKITKDEVPIIETAPVTSAIPATTTSPATPITVTPAAPALSVPAASSTPVEAVPVTPPVSAESTKGIDEPVAPVEKQPDAAVEKPSDK